MKANELAEQMFPEPQMEDYDDILEYRNDMDWTIIARGAVVKGYNQAEQDLMEKVCKWIEDNFSLYEGISGYHVAKELKQSMKDE